MAHSYSRSAFKIVSRTPPLAYIYNSLVAVELALKDHLHPPWRGGHDIPDLLSAVGEGALGVQLQGALGKLHCTSRNGSSALVPASNFPAIRYLRHESDFAGTSSENDILGAVAVVDDIRARLPMRGVNF